jgi:hypothetical protein
VLVVFDADFVYGENFFIFTTEEDKTQWLLNQRIRAAEARALAKASKKKKAPVGADGGDAAQEEEDDEEEEEEAEAAEAAARANRPAKWESLGSEQDIEAAAWAFSRPPIKLLVSRRRRYFGVPVTLSDRVYSSKPEEDEGDGEGDAPPKGADPDAIEYRAIVPEEGEVAPALVYRSRMDVATQAIPTTASTASQSDWRPKRNRALQYEPLTRSTASASVGNAKTTRTTATTSTTTTATSPEDTANAAKAEEADLCAFLATVLAPVEVHSPPDRPSPRHAFVGLLHLITLPRMHCNPVSSQLVTHAHQHFVSDESHTLLTRADAC